MSEQDTRTIQEVLRLHIDSVQGMIEMDERQGDAMGVLYEEGKKAGLLRAIEVADYRARTKADKSKNDRDVLLSVGDGPDHIEIYTSVDEGIVDWSKDSPALYLTATCGMNSQVKLGPFGLSHNLIEQLRERLK